MAPNEVKVGHYYANYKSDHSPAYFEVIDMTSCRTRCRVKVVYVEKGRHVAIKKNDTYWVTVSKLLRLLEPVPKNTMLANIVLYGDPE